MLSEPSGKGYTMNGGTLPLQHHYHHHLAVLQPFHSPHHALNKNQRQSQIYPLCNKASCCRRYPVLLPNAFPSSSISGSPEELLSKETRQKRKRIAGVDQDELLDPRLLADLDSCFCEFQGVHIHYKIRHPQSQACDSVQKQCQGFSQFPAQTKKDIFPMILLHGFGASVFSWDRVMKPLAKRTGSEVIAFDRPAFGLTSRVANSIKHSSSSTKDPEPLNPYSMAFSVLATLYFIDFLAADKAILVGHSAGSLVAINSYFEAPERVAALILVAPAILAPHAMHNVVESSKSTEADGLVSTNKEKLFSKLLETLLKFIKSIAQVIMQMVKGMTVTLNSLFKKALSAIICSAFAVVLVRMVIDKLGIAAVRNAWYDSKQVTEQVIHGYTMPLRAKGWDRALVEFMAAMLKDSKSESNPPLAKRLHKISCPVLIVAGDTDRIVPSWNAKRLSQAIPGSTLEVIKNCGHLPHEEKVEEFVSVVEKFLQRVFGRSV